MVRTLLGKAMGRMHASVLRRASKRLTRALLDPEVSREGPHADVLFQTLLVRIDDETAAELQEKVSEIRDLLVSRSLDDEDAAGRLVQFLVLKTPIV